MAASQPGRPGGDGGERRLRAQLGGNPARGRARGSGRRSEAGPPFRQAAGRLAKNDPIDAETIARFAEAFPDDSAQPHDRAREELARLVQAREALKDVQERIKQQREHQPPAIVVEALAAVAKTLRAEMRKLEASIAANNQGEPGVRASRRAHRRRAGARRSNHRRVDRLAA